MIQMMNEEQEIKQKIISKQKEEREDENLGKESQWAKKEINGRGEEKQPCLGIREKKEQVPWI